MEWGPVKTNQIMSYYPKYTYLDDVLSITGKSNLNLYIDLKGCLQSLFQKWAVEYIISQSQGTRLVDTSVFSSVLEFISFHKQYAKKRNIKMNMYFFLESGKSFYHKEIYKDYKSNRGIGDFFGLDDAKRELFFQVIDKNYHVIDKVCNKIPNVSVHRLMFLEADFVPWYLMKCVLPKEVVQESANIIYSTDKDMLQCLDSNNMFQFYKHYKHVKMLTGKDALSHILKKEVNLPMEWFCMALAIIGDEGDGFKGVPSIGGTRCAEMLPQIATICGGSMEKVYQNILQKQPIFDKSYDIKNDGSLKRVLECEDIVVRNLKLLSFRLLSEHVNGCFPTDMIDKKKQLEENTNNLTKAPNSSVLFNALEKAGLAATLNERTIINLF